MEIINLSYVITTYNKLQYLNFVMDSLLENIQPDEEIVVVDGGSSDGTKEYLQNLFEKGKIHQFLSESDKGEAHGFNKGLLLAKGVLIKILTDDDSYYYPGIRKCKEFMLKNKQFDCLASNVATTYLFNDKTISFSDSSDNAKAWAKKEIKCFPFIGLGIMIRKASLPLTGLFNTAIKLVDSEFSLRVTSTCNFVWYTGIIGIRAGNKDSNYFKFFNEIKNESKNNALFYGFKKQIFTKIERKRSIQYIKEKIYYPIIEFYRNKILKKPLKPNKISINQYYNYYDYWLQAYNEKTSEEFLSRNFD